MEITVTVDRAKLNELVSKFDHFPALKRKALSSSINRALTSGRTIIRRQIQKELNVSTEAVQRTIGIRGATEASPGGSIVVSRKPTPLMAYHPTQTRNGVHVRVRKGRGVETLPLAFIAKLASGHIGVFVRYGPRVAPTKGRYSGKIARRGPHKGEPILRQKIKEVYGPTIAGHLAGKPGLLQDVADEMGSVLLVRLQSQISRFFETK
jgi:hypothetical protein